MIGSLNSSGEGEEVDSLRCKYDFLFYTLLPYQEAEENEYLQMRDLMFNFNLQNDDGRKIIRKILTERIIHAQYD